MSVISRLTPKDKKALALFYETETYSSLIKLLKLVKANAASKALSAVDFSEVKQLQGQKAALDRLEEELKSNYKLNQKS